MGIKRGARILIVDDHQDNVELLQARLEARGYETETATNGQQALERRDLAGRARCTSPGLASRGAGRMVYAGRDRAGPGARHWAGGVRR